MIAICNYISTVIKTISFVQAENNACNAVLNSSQPLVIFYSMPALNQMKLYSIGQMCN